MAILLLAGMVGAIAAIARGVYLVGEMEIQHQAQLPPAPAYTLPHQWGGPLPPIEPPDGMRPIRPMSSYPQAPPPAPWVEPSPVPIRDIGNPELATGSGVLVTGEPHPPVQGDGPDLVALLAAAPYPLEGVYSSDEMALFSALKGSGRKQTEVIQAMYHAAKGGTQRYQKARDRYMVLLKHWIPTQQSGDQN